MTDSSRNRHVLPPYRGQPPEIRYGRGEHAPVCDWCRWSDNPTCGKEWATRFNDRSQCECYYPSLWTRLLLRLRLRPWVERPADESEDDE